MDSHLREEILTANRTLHKDEAAFYDRIHPELTNEVERSRLERVLNLATANLREKQSYRALDVGTGTGFVSQALLKRGFTVDAVDISAEMIERLRMKEPEALANGRLETIVKDVDTFFTQTKNRYHMIAASSVLHHFPDYSETIRAMMSHLEPGGSLVFFHEPCGGEAGPLELLLRRVDWKLSRTFIVSSEDLHALKQLNLDYAMADYHVTHGFDEENVQACLRAEGFETIHLERYTTAQTGLMRWIFGIFFPSRTWTLVAKKRG